MKVNRPDSSNAALGRLISSTVAPTRWFAAAVRRTSRTSRSPDAQRAPRLLLALRLRRNRESRSADTRCPAGRSFRPSSRSLTITRNVSLAVACQFPLPSIALLIVTMTGWNSHGFEARGHQPTATNACLLHFEESRIRLKSSVACLANSRPSSESDSSEVALSHFASHSAAGSRPTCASPVNAQESRPSKATALFLSSSMTSIDPSDLLRVNRRSDTWKACSPVMHDRISVNG